MPRAPAPLRRSCYDPANGTSRGIVSALTQLSVRLMKTAAACSTALIAFASVGSLEAHHSISMFDIGTPIWIEGTVVDVNPVNPHVLFTLERQLGDGEVERWTVEGPSLRAFNQRGGNGLEPGQVIEVCGFGVKDEFRTRDPDAEARRRERPGLHGHVLVMPDGHMEIFGGYGKLVNCVRETDDFEAWVAFLDAGARNAWCSGRTSSSFPTVAPQAFVDEVERRMADPCLPSAKN